MSTPDRYLLNSASKVTNSEKKIHVPGSIIGNRYQIIQKLGREEIRKTYLAKDLQATGDARCAVEQLSPVCNKTNWQLIKQHLIREVEVLKRLGDHPQIPQFYNYFIEDRQFYLVREYIDGDNLEQEVERKVLDEAQVIHLMQDALRILDFVHKTNVIHRDVQPIHLVRRKRDRNFVLINFGAIREIESTALDFQGEVISSKSLDWAYIAPEQQSGESNFGSDIYALAQTAIYALTGKSPQELEQANTTWQSQCQISSKLEAILSRMTLFNIEERYPSALEVLYDLRPLLKLKQVVGGRYAITRYLGGKKRIETYLADNLRRQYQSPCLIKQIELPNVQGNGETTIEKRFAEELSILERLGYHEQIPQLRDHFTENDQFYLVQEYIPGENLALKIEQQDLSTAQIINILISTLGVLNFIHQNRIIHRNIRPSNLLIRSEDQQVVLTDFGILTDIGTLPNATLDSSQTQDKQNYCSPEQIAGRPTISSDIYALGMTAIEALTKIKPGRFSRDRQTGKLLWQENLAVDRRFAKIIDKMVYLDLGQRYQSASKILDDLQKIKSVSKSATRKPLGQKKRKTANHRQSQFKLPILPVLIGFLGLICLLGSIEFAFPTVRPIYYWYQGKKLLPKKPQAALNVFTKAIELKAGSSLAWSGRGDALYNLGRYSKALEAYSEATKLSEADFKIWKKQGDSYYQLEQFTKAIAAYNRALELEQKDGELYNHKGKALYELKNYDAALSMQDSAIDLDSSNAEFLSDRAKNLLALNKYDNALTVLNRVQAIEPSSVELWQDKPLVLAALNRPQEAERVNQEIIGNYQQLLQNQLQDPQIWLTQAEFFANSQMYQKAINSFEQAIKLKPNFYQAWLGKGKALAKLNQGQKALTALDKALQIRSESYLAWQAKGQVYQNQQNNLAMAIASYSQAISLNSNYAPLWRDRGLAFNQQQNYTQGIESLTKASKIAPQDHETWIGLATAWDMVGQDTKALTALDRAIEIQPQNVAAWSQKGLIFTKNAQYNEACETYRQSRLAIPNSQIILDSMRTLGCRIE
ncbi:protein kinase domain-containing protein [Pleurocapsa sp. FMAR1]|uniref:protein kinase domain-containing protein n=1 Tax=Pleurocapsa sp. FMAR1 TaxID=3040204 RepID=UPI0029C76134|nr:tetratricopeptide repeat protein [Pleurocapsa sp. FMAR1]